MLSKRLALLSFTLVGSFLLFANATPAHAQAVYAGPAYSYPYPYAPPYVCDPYVNPYCYSG